MFRPRVAIGVAAGLIGLLVTACAPVPEVPPTAQDWRLRLTREVIIPAGRARAMFQDGRQVGGVDRYRPHCEFEINTVSEQPQRVAPDRLFVVRRERRVVTDENAAIPAFFSGPFDCDRDNFYESLYWLRAEQQPGVRRLLCRDWFRSCDLGRHLSLDEILEVLGPGFRLE